MSLTIKLTIIIVGIVVFYGFVYYLKYRRRKKHLANISSGKFAIEKSILRHRKREDKKKRAKKS